MDWQGELIKATGSGAPDMRSLSPAQARLGAEKAAQLDAFRNLIAIAKGIHISADKTVGQAMANDEVKGRVEGVVKGFKVVKKRYFSDQGVEMDVEVPLSGIAQAVLDPGAPAVNALASAKTPMAATPGCWWMHAGSGWCRCSPRASSTGRGRCSTPPRCSMPRPGRTRSRRGTSRGSIRRRTPRRSEALR